LRTKLSSGSPSHVTGDVGRSNLLEREKKRKKEKDMPEI
jgi:hypothetical protein